MEFLRDGPGIICRSANYLAMLCLKYPTLDSLTSPDPCTMGGVSVKERSPFSSSLHEPNPEPSFRPPTPNPTLFIFSPRVNYPALNPQFIEQASTSASMPTLSDPCPVSPPRSARKSKEISPNAKIQLFVKTLEGVTVVVQVDTCTTVLELKRVLESRLREFGFQLRNGQRLLLDEMVLSQVVKMDSTVYMTCALPGGGPRWANILQVAASAKNRSMGVKSKVDETRRIPKPDLKGGKVHPGEPERIKEVKVKETAKPDSAKVNKESGTILSKINIIPRLEWRSVFQSSKQKTKDVEQTNLSEGNDEDTGKDVRDVPVVEEDNEVGVDSDESTSVHVSVEEAEETSENDEIEPFDLFF